MHIQKLIERLGFSSNESRVYLAALSVGDATTSEISRQAHLPRTSCQSILENLHTKGLVHYYPKSNRRYWIAENPEHLLLTIKGLEGELREIMPKLHALRAVTGVKPSVKFYEGGNNIAVILNNIIEERKHIVAVISLEDTLALLGDNFRFFLERQYKTFLRLRLLTNRSIETALLKRRDEAELRETRFLQEKYRIKNANFVYGDKVAILSLNKKKPIGIVIEDDDIAETQNMFFESLWTQGAHE